MNQYKTSKYNHYLYIEEEEKFLVYNAISNGLATLEPDVFDLLKAGDVGVAQLESDGSKKELLESLRKGNLIVEQDYDEVEFLRTRFNIGKYGQNALTLTIVTTTDCNLLCQYCYQGESVAIRPYDGLESDIVRFTEERILSCGYRHLGVSWYGGEPLLNTAFIYSLSAKLMALCKKHHVNYNAMVVSNGTLLSKKVATTLKRYKVQNMQITVDGPPAIHDSRRPFKKGHQSSFAIIMKNIQQAFGIIPITIRVNVDKTNISNTMELLELLNKKGYLNNTRDLFVYLGYTREWTHKCKDVLPGCFSMKEFSQAEMDFQKELIAKGYNSTNLYPRPQHICSAVTPHGFVIEPGGEIHKCWSDVNNPDSYIGHVKHPLQINSKMLQWLRFDPFTQFSECSDCSLFPICGGGCPYVAIKQQEKIAADKYYNCTPWKSLMNEKLQIFLQAKAQELSKK